MRLLHLYHYVFRTTPVPREKMMSIEITADPVPFSEDLDGFIRIGGTRVPLETVLDAFSNGSTPEEILQQYPSLALADIYSVIGYSLRRRQEIERYMERVRIRSDLVRKENERRFDPNGIRDRLMARRNRNRVD